MPLGPAAAGACRPRLHLAQARLRGPATSGRTRPTPRRSAPGRSASCSTSAGSTSSPSATRTTGARDALSRPGGLARHQRPRGGGGADGGGADPVQPLLLAHHRRHAAARARPRASRRPTRGNEGNARTNYAGVQLPQAGAGRLAGAAGDRAFAEHPVLHRELPRRLRQAGHRADPLRLDRLLPGGRRSALRLRPRAGEPAAGRGGAPARRGRDAVLAAAAPGPLGRGHRAVLHLHPAIAGRGRHPRGDRAAGRGGLPAHRLQRPRLRPGDRLAPVPERPGGEHDGLVPLRQPEAARPGRTSGAGRTR